MSQNQEYCIYAIKPIQKRIDNGKSKKLCVVDSYINITLKLENGKLVIIYSE